MRRKLRFGALLAAVLAGPPCRANADSAATPKATERVFDLPLSAGDSQTVLLLSPPHPRGSIVMLPGGAGNIGIGRNGDLRHGDNFVVRTRQLWVARGYAVLIPEALDGLN